MTTPAIEIAGLEKPYGGHPVLRGVDLSVPAGTVVALLGSNGAGTTTAVKILATLLRADGGTARAPATTSRPGPSGSAPRSASPASSPPSRCCPAGRRAGSGEAGR